MTSSVLDATLCLLLVSAAVVTVVTGVPATPADDGRADAVAETLATTTATVNYSLAAQSGVSAGRSSRNRTVHGTLAGLLARAAVADVTIDGVRPTRAHDGLRTRLVRRVGALIRDGRTNVSAVWYPAPGTGVRGDVAVGARPPPGTDVHAATLTVPSGYPLARDAALDEANEGGVAAVSNVTADRTVSGMFPPTRT